MSTKRVAPKKMIVILGPTAVGKTNLAVQLAITIKGEIISADSRQVYQGMDIGTGKDLDEYLINGNKVESHLIDILKSGDTYNLFDFQQDFYEAYKKIKSRDKTPILCGGTGLYIDAAINPKQMIRVKEDSLLRQELETLNQEELIEKLVFLNPKQHNQTDTINRDRTVRAIEIEIAKQKQKTIDSPVGEYIVFGIKTDRSFVRERIEIRLKDRLNNGMIEEVETLVKQGVSYERLNYYGLEYKFIGQYLSGQLNNEEMYSGLLQAIHRFAKKQMTWFRRMEKNGTQIHWIDGSWTMEEKLGYIQTKLA